ncbi:BamA/TamA family outer membrane protein [Desertivirga brevis]|uniref:BamA/TamA family outer membrane protein n=1 Tax=Desertivirga brevis TaxID=2810310 RepID=UPI001A962BF7|nr:BamA/TamA family outer membrane protein [Pedobacter sp. SYSU D00873]
MKLAIISAIFIILANALNAQDSTVVKAHPSYNDHGKIHRVWFGENYRQEWAIDTKVPLLRISQIQGGLTPTTRGGGHQTHSLRLTDKKGNEWVIRSIEKFPEVLIPEQIRNTFAKDWVDDNMSAQHPYAALIVPVLAEATGVPHTNPVIGVVAPDAALGEFAADFENKLVLLEEREPLGKSDNTLKMFAALDADSKNRVNAEGFLKAQLLDVIIGDWDRHIDQWRWKDIQEGEGKQYLAVPRDRDQVFYVNQGLFPNVASRSWLLPFLQGFDSKVRNINTYLWESRLMVSRILNELSYEQWMDITREVVAALPDEVLEASLKRLPESSYKLRHKALLANMKSQRENLLKESEKFYRFINETVEIKASDKNEYFSLNAEGENLNLEIFRLSGSGKKELVFSKIIRPEFTKEVWLYTGKGNDKISINNPSKIKVRIVAAEGEKLLDAAASSRPTHLYAKADGIHINSNDRAFRKHFSGDTLHTRYIPINRYNVNMPLITGGFNRDDGFILGAGIKHTHQGFRKVPYASEHEFTVAHSFSTSAFRIKYNGDWKQVIGKADLTINAAVYGPNNTINFYGRGNETLRLRGSRSDLFYRSRFNLATLSSGLKWNLTENTSFTAGPVFQYYSYQSSENIGRFISSNYTGSYDSESLDKDKFHGGLSMNLLSDHRSNTLLPASGTYVKIKAEGLAGLNEAAKSFVQVTPEFRWYKKLMRDSALVFAHRIGGGITLGDAAFYQSLFLGGHDNLYGFHQYRFAGEQMLYNNIELRLRIAKLATYILPGEVGISSFYDTGRVWVDGEKSDQWHHGVGGGVYLAPANYALIQFIAGHSTEGWYPYLKLSARF